MVSLLRYFRLSSRSKRAYAVYLENAPDGSLSTEESATGETWIDGSPIYSKTFEVAAGPNNSLLTIAHNISGLGTIIGSRSGGMIATSNNSDIRFLPHTPNGEATNGILLTFDATNIYIQSTADYSNHVGHVTMVYTKS